MIIMLNQSCEALVKVLRALELQSSLHCSNVGGEAEPVWFWLQMMECTFALCFILTCCVPGAVRLISSSESQPVKQVHAGSLVAPADRINEPRWTFM